jgi:hypothetical protein
MTQIREIVDVDATSKILASWRGVFTATRRVKERGGQAAQGCTA